MKTLLIMAMTMLVLIIAQGINIIIFQYKQTLTDTYEEYKRVLGMVDVSMMFTMLNPVLNSVIYISRSKTLRRVLKSDKSSFANKKN